MGAVYSEETMQRIEAIERACRDQFVVAADRLLWIKPQDAPITRFKLNFAQRYVHDTYFAPAWRDGFPLALLIHKARRLGMSTLVEGEFFHKVRWFKGQSCLILAHRDETVDELHQMIHRFHDNLPPELQPEIDRKNKKEFAYKSPINSSIRVMPAGYIDVSRGTNIQHAHGSEVAHYPDPEAIFAGLLKAVPDFGRTSIVLESTANGVDTWWHNLWKAVGKKSMLGKRQWKRVFIPWFWDPSYTLPVPRDFERTEYDQEIQTRFHLKDEQLAWYHAQEAEFEAFYPGRGLQMLRQEFPTTAEEGFVASGECIFPGVALDMLRKQRREPVIGFELKQTGTWQYTLFAKPVSDEPPMLVWEGPKSGYQYAIGVDVSRGVGRDDSAVVVVRLPGFTTVAHWKHNYTSTKHLAYIVAAIARYYASGSGSLPIVAVEINDAGLGVNYECQDLMGTEPFLLFVWRPLDRLGTAMVTPQSRTGWLTTASTKPILVSIANSLLMAGFCEVPSEELQVDMSRTQEVVPGQYRTSGCDLTIAWLLATMVGYLDIAKWDIPGLQTLKGPDEQEAEQRLKRDQTHYDTGFQEIMSRGRARAMPGDPRTSWLVQ